MLFGSQDRKELAQVQTFLRPMPMIWPDASDVRLASTFARLKLSHGVGFLDAVTAAIAIRASLTVVTFNVRHFQAIPGVKTLRPNWRVKLD